MRIRLLIFFLGFIAFPGARAQGGFTYYHGDTLISKQKFDSILRFSRSVSVSKNLEEKKMSISVESVEDEESRKALQNSRSAKWLNQPAQAFEATDLQDRVVNANDLKGKVVVLNFYFTACGPCLREMPALNNLTKKYADRDVIFLAFALDEKEKLAAFLQKTQFAYRQVPGGKSLASAYGIETYPTHIVIDKKGTIRLFSEGYQKNTLHDLEDMIERVL